MSRSCRSDGASVIGASAAVLGVFSICALAACGWISDESPRCLAGESRLCHCASGAAGRQVCLEDGRSLGPCECEAAGTPEGVEELASGTAPTPAADESTTPGPAVALAAAAPPSPAGSALSAPPGVDAATLGLWRFDEGSGETAADSGPRALSGAVLGASWTDGRFGKALLLDGTTSHVRLPASTEIRPLGPFTIEAWVRPESSREMEVVSLAEALGLSLRPRDAAVEAVFQIPLGGQPQVLVSSEPLALWQWHHVAGTWDASTMRLYVDGRFAGEAPAPGALAFPDGCEAGAVGSSCRPNGGGWLHGGVDEVRVSSAVRYVRGTEGGPDERLGELAGERPVKTTAGGARPGKAPTTPGGADGGPVVPPGLPPDLQDLARQGARALGL